MGDFAMSRSFPLSGGYRIRHFKVTLGSTPKDFFTDVFASDSKMSGVEILYRLRIIVTNNGKARLNINGCADTNANAILVDYEHPWNESMPVKSLVGIRDGTTDAQCEVTVWY